MVCDGVGYGGVMLDCVVSFVSFKGLFVGVVVDW